MRKVIVIIPLSDNRMHVFYNNGGGEILSIGAKRYDAAIRLMATMERAVNDEMVFYRATPEQYNKRFS